MNIKKFQFDQNSEMPIYQQISNYIRQLIATENLKAGDHLPAVRSMASALGINQNTVSRAYKQLEQEEVVISRRGGGTIVRKNGDDPSIIANRQWRLSHITYDNIMKSLSLGYTVEEIETEFLSNIAKWRKERNSIVEVPQDVIEIKKLE